MVATSDLDGLRDDLHIVNKLKEKEEAVYQSLGDAASVYKLYEASAEEELVTTAIATGNKDMLDGAPTSEESVSLFENDKSYYTALLEQLKSDNSLKTDDEIKQLEFLLPDVIKFAHQLHMDQQQQKLQLEMEKEMAVYEEKMKSWKRSKEYQIEIEFGDKPEYGFLKRRRKDMEIEIETILNRSSQYFKDLTSLNSVPYLKVLAVFYN